MLAPSASLILTRTLPVAHPRPQFGNYSVIRSVRALRPLRALKRVPGMPVLVSSIMACIPKMGDVAMLCAFVFLVFGIVGMELFKGALHYRCALPGYVEPAGIPSAERRRMQLATPDVGPLEISGRAAPLATDYQGDGTIASDPFGVNASDLFGGGNWLADAGIVPASHAAAAEHMLVAATDSMYATVASAAAAAAAAAAFRPFSSSAMSTATESAARGETRRLHGGRSGPSRRRLKGMRESAGDAGNVAHDTGNACNPARSDQCDPGQTCSYFAMNPSNDLESFDSVGVAFIILLQAITFDDWATSM